MNQNTATFVKDDPDDAQPPSAVAAGPRSYRRRVVVAALALVALVALSAAMLRRWVVQPMITGMEVQLYRHDQGQIMTLGQIGRDAGYAQVKDDLRIVVTLAEPAYAFLLALNTDGKPQLCLPEDDHEPPPRTARLTLYPDTSAYFTLTEGPGLQGFVVVASRSPLPAYRDWFSHHGTVGWTRMETAGVWRSDGDHFAPITPGKEGARPGGDEPGMRTIRVPEPFAQACRSFRHLPDVDAVAGICFPVKPSLEFRSNR